MDSGDQICVFGVEPCQSMCASGEQVGHRLTGERAQVIVGGVGSLCVVIEQSGDRCGEQFGLVLVEVIVQVATDEVVEAPASVVLDDQMGIAKRPECGASVGDRNFGQCGSGLGRDVGAGVERKHSQQPCRFGLPFAEAGD